MDSSVEDRFWSKVRRHPTDCWEWQRAKNKQGYGVFALTSRTMVSAHRFAWMSAEGPIPEGLCVLHRCDNPKCVRPGHLFLGTFGDNNRDCSIKGRWRGGSPPGERHGSARLSEKDVLFIRASHEKNVPLARRFGVNRQTIADVRDRRTWRHI